jgi:hypothetical protein
MVRARATGGLTAVEHSGITHYRPHMLAQRVKIGTFLANAGGSQSITGVGFKPNVLIFFATDGVGIGTATSFGFDDGTSHCVTYYKGGLGAGFYRSTESIYIFVDASNIIKGYVSSMDADGFTLTWTLTGGATARVVYLAIE